MSFLDEISEVVGEGSPVGQPSGEEVGTGQVPGRSVGQRIWQRFFGTDVTDPMTVPRTGSTIVGGLSGALTGLAAGGPPGAVLGAFAGVIGGAVAPEAVMEAGEKIGLFKPGTRQRFGLSDPDLRTLVEGEVLLEAATAGGISAARLGGRTIARAVTGVGREGSRLADVASREGIALLPVQVGSRTLPRSFVSVAGRFPWIATSLRKRASLAEANLKTAVENFPTRIAPVSTMTDVSYKLFSDMKDLVGGISEQAVRDFDDLFRRSHAAGVRIDPINTVTKAEELLKQIAAETPQAAKGRMALPAQSLYKIQQFIESRVMPISGQTAKGNQIFSAQTLQSMDGLLTAIDEEIAAAIKSKQSADIAPVRYLESMRQAVQMDLARNARGAGASDYVAEFNDLDTQLSHTMATIFDTAAAKRFGTVRRFGVKGINYDAYDFDKGTPVDALSSVLLRGDSPQIAREVARFADPRTMKSLVSTVVADRIERSMTVADDGFKHLNVSNLTKQFGLDNPRSPRYRQTEELLRASGGLTMKELDDFVKIGQAIASVEIPNVSTFIARRTVMGGKQSLVNTILPGAVGGATVAGGTIAFGSSALFGAALFIGGGKMISRLISNPISARMIRTVMDDEVSTVVRRSAWIKAMRAGIVAMNEEGSFSPNWTMQDTMDTLDRTILWIDEKIENTKGRIGRAIYGE